MTSDDELLKRLDYYATVGSNSVHEKAAARIRELEGEVIHWKYETSSANARIRELEAELKDVKLSLEAADAEIDVERHLGESEKLIAGTHVIVPVEPTKAMIQAALMRYTGGYMSRQFDEIYCAMIKAANNE